MNLNDPHSVNISIGLLVALGCGLLIGIERERRKGKGEDREAAGVRTFTVTALLGALAQLLPAPGLIAAGAVVIGLLIAISYWKSRSRDPGMTTELALLATYLIGVQCVISPAIGAACGAGLAGLLAARNQLHRFATQLLSDQELHDGLLLLALALIALPLIPSQPISWLGGINPRPLAMLVLLIMAIQAGGHMALRALGPRAGLLLSGFVYGFISSTATMASFGSQARANPTQTKSFAAGASLSAAATWVQAWVISATLSPPAAIALLPVALAGLIGAATVGAIPGFFGKSAPKTTAPTQQKSTLRPRQALGVGLMLAIAAVLIGQTQSRYGDIGLNISVALAALVDAHAPIASLAGLHAGGMLKNELFIRGVLIALTANTLMRCIVASIAGGYHFTLRVATALLSSLGLAWLVGWWAMSG